MACPRCQSETDLVKSGWCKPCELLYDAWVRRYATDIIWSVMGGGVVLMFIGIGLPLLGVGTLSAAFAAVTGFGTILGSYRLAQRRRRRQFLRGQLPRAYIPAPK